MTVPVCSICAWRDKFEFSYIAQLANEIFQAQSAAAAFAGTSLCNHHAYMFHDLASAETTALAVAELIRRDGAISTPVGACVVCRAMETPERELVLRESGEARPRLCRAHVNRLRALGTGAERVAAAEQSFVERATVLLEELNDQKAPDMPLPRRVGSALRMYAGTPGVTD